jgi:putative tryptophan/tyrosine transport system substrate-binding protein
VFTIVADPITLGFINSFERPGKNLTGVTNTDAELPIRQMKLLKELFPALKKVSILSDEDLLGKDASGLALIERDNMAAARDAGLSPLLVRVRAPTPDFDPAFKAMGDEGAEALVVLEVPALFNVSRKIAELATARRLPSLFWGGQGDGGGLLAYGTSFTATYGRVPVYVDRVLKGAKPADTPVEIVSVRELEINLATARKMGLSIPAEFLKRANRVVE